MRSLFRRIAWKLWGRRIAIRQMRKLFNAPPPTRRDNDQIYRTLSYDDMNLDHYKRINESLPKEVLPPPNVDDTGLN